MSIQFSSSVCFIPLPLPYLTSLLFQVNSLFFCLSSSNLIPSCHRFSVRVLFSFVSWIFYFIFYFLYIYFFWFLSSYWSDMMSRLCLSFFIFSSGLFTFLSKTSSLLSLFSTLHRVLLIWVKLFMTFVRVGSDIMVCLSCVYWKINQVVN